MRPHSNHFWPVIALACTVLTYAFGSIYEDALKSWVLDALARQGWEAEASIVTSRLIQVVPSLGLAILTIAGLYWYFDHEFESSWNSTRLRLAELRSEGVALRNRGIALQTQQEDFKKWSDDVDKWNRTTIDTIAEADPADAEWFSVLDTIPPPRVALYFPRTQHEGDHLRIHGMLDCRLARLDDLLASYGEV